MASGSRIRQKRCRRAAAAPKSSPFGWAGERRAVRRPLRPRSSADPSPRPPRGLRVTAQRPVFLSCPGGEAPGRVLAKQPPSKETRLRWETHAFPGEPVRRWLGTCRAASSARPLRGSRGRGARAGRRSGHWPPAAWRAMLAVPPGCRIEPALAERPQVLFSQGWAGLAWSEKGVDGVGGRSYSRMINGLLSPEAPDGVRESWPSLRILDAGLRCLEWSKRGRSASTGSGSRPDAVLETRAREPCATFKWAGMSGIFVAAIPIRVPLTRLRGRLNSEGSSAPPCGARCCSRARSPSGSFAPRVPRGGRPRRSLGRRRERRAGMGRGPSAGFPHRR